jgi:hypothetical protein
MPPDQGVEMPFSDAVPKWNRKFTVCMTQAQYDELQRLAFEHQTVPSTLVRVAIARLLEHEQRPPAT